MNGYLHYFVVDRNIRASAALSELALAIPRCRNDPFSGSFLSASVRLWNLLLSGVFSCCTFSSFKSTMNLYLLRT